MSSGLSKQLSEKTFRHGTWSAKLPATDRKTPLLYAEGML